MIATVLSLDDRRLSRTSESSVSESAIQLARSAGYKVCLLSCLQYWTFDHVTSCRRFHFISHHVSSLILDCKLNTQSSSSSRPHTTPTSTILALSSLVMPIMSETKASRGLRCLRQGTNVNFSIICGNREWRVDRGVLVRESAFFETLCIGGFNVSCITPV